MGLLASAFRGMSRKSTIPIDLFRELLSGTSRTASTGKVVM